MDPYDSFAPSGPESLLEGQPTATDSDEGRTRVLGYSWTDPTTGFVQGEHTLKNGSYYKRNWVTGNPYSALPAWLDMDHVPPRKQEFVVRTDLALNAMQAILRRIEAEELGELARRQALQDKRQERLARLRQRHTLRHEAQARISAAASERNHLSRSFSSRLQLSASTPSLYETMAEEREAERAADAAVLPASPTLSASASMKILSRMAPEGGSIQQLKKAPQSTMHWGLEGLAIPKYPVLEQGAPHPSTSSVMGRTSRSSFASPARSSGGGRSTPGSVGRSGSMGSVGRPTTAPGVPRLNSALAPPALGWADPSGPIPRGRKSPAGHFETGLSPYKLPSPYKPPLSPDAALRAARALS